MKRLMMVIVSGFALVALPQGTWGQSSDVAVDAAKVFSFSSYVSRPSGLSGYSSSRDDSGASGAADTLADSPGEVTLPAERPDAALFARFPPAGGVVRPISHPVISSKPFSSIGVSVRVGPAGVGGEVATPIGPRVNARIGFDYYSFYLNTSDDNIQYFVDLQLRRGTIGFDIFPFSARYREAFRITPGLVFYNGNRGTATATVAGGQSFSLGDSQYMSDPDDPINGSAAVDFGKKIAPSLTIGFGNIIPRDGARFSVLFEAGAEYVDHIGVTLNLQGSACQMGGCGPIATDPDAQANVLMEETELSHDLSPLRFYPIFQLGFGWRFGPKVAGESHISKPPPLAIR